MTAPILSVLTLRKEGNRVVFETNNDHVVDPSGNRIEMSQVGNLPSLEITFYNDGADLPNPSVGSVPDSYL